MGYRINTNIASQSAQRSLIGNREANNRATEKIATGTRVVRAGDDAAGLAISEKLKANIRSLGQANRNANDGVSVIQTAEGGMVEVQNILVRLRELSMQAASDTVGGSERGFMDKEVSALVNEVDRIAAGTKFNRTRLLDGSNGLLEFQVGLENNQYEDRLSYDTNEINITASALGVSGMSVASKLDAQRNFDRIDLAIRKLNSQRAGLGALQNRLQSTMESIMVARENLSAANSRIRDTDIAAEVSNAVKSGVLLQSSTSMLAQANVAPERALDLL